MIPGRGQGEFHEGVKACRGVDRVRAEAGEGGTAVGEVCRKAGISEAIFYNRRKCYGDVMPSEVKRLRQLEEESAKLKRIVADLSLDKAMQQDVLSKKL